jgi:hypothetical protein
MELGHMIPLLRWEEGLGEEVPRVDAVLTSSP